MDKMQIVIIFAGLIGIGGMGAIAYVFLGAPNSRGPDVRGLLASGNATPRARGENGERLEVDIEEIKRRTAGTTSSKKGKDDISTKLFKAGFFTSDDRQRFKTFRAICPIFTTILCAVGLHFWLQNPALTTSGLVLGLFIGFAWPLSWLERQIRRREEETMYYLPLVIEQVSIGVSSSLDIGPCVANVVQMATERDSHNPVTEMFVHVEKLIRSGLNLEDALVEVGETNGMTEVKHAFMFLAQCAKHGGEISRQLQELADSVMVQRQVQVEARIAALPVKATGPLATVFAGFFALLFAGLLVRLMSAFGGS